MFRGLEKYIRSIAAHNVYENVGRVQEVGTGMLLYGPLVDQYDFEQSGKYDTWLVRWLVMAFQGPEGIKNRIVCGYNLC